ncbi:hypothetical protein PS2_005142 [Malus domestica]
MPEIQVSPLSFFFPAPNLEPEASLRGWSLEHVGGSIDSRKLSTSVKRDISQIQSLAFTFAAPAILNSAFDIPQRLQFFEIPNTHSASKGEVCRGRRGIAKGCFVQRRRQVHCADFCGLWLNFHSSKLIQINCCMLILFLNQSFVFV